MSSKRGINIRDRQTGSPRCSHRHHTRRVQSLSPFRPAAAPGRCVGARPRPCTIHPRRWPRSAPRPARTRRAILRDTTDHADPNIQRHARPRSQRSAASSLQPSLPPPHLPVLPHSAITDFAAEIRSSPVLHRKGSSVSKLMRGLIGIQADERTHRYPG